MTIVAAAPSLAAAVLNLVVKWLGQWPLKRATETTEAIDAALEQQIERCPKICKFGLNPSGFSRLH